MEAKSLYEIGQQLFTISDHKLIQFTVSRIWITINSEKKVSVSYVDDSEPYNAKFHDEEHCYPTKESLIRNLE